MRRAVVAVGALMFVGGMLGLARSLDDRHAAVCAIIALVGGVAGGVAAAAPTLDRQEDTP